MIRLEKVTRKSLWSLKKKSCVLLIIIYRPLENWKKDVEGPGDTAVAWAKYCSPCPELLAPQIWCASCCLCVHILLSEVHSRCFVLWTAMMTRTKTRKQSHMEICYTSKKNRTRSNFKMRRETYSTFIDITEYVWLWLPNHLILHCDFLITLLYNPFCNWRTTCNKDEQIFY